MMREVVALIAGIVLAGYALFFALPMLNTEKSAMNALLNATDPTIALSQSLGQGFYNALPFIPIIVGVFLIISYALRRDPLE